MDRLNPQGFGYTKLYQNIYILIIWCRMLQYGILFTLKPLPVTYSLRDFSSLEKQSEPSRHKSEFLYLLNLVDSLAQY